MFSAVWGNKLRFFTQKHRYRSQCDTITRLERMASSKSKFWSMNRWISLFKFLGKPMILHVNAKTRVNLNRFLYFFWFTWTLLQIWLQVLTWSESVKRIRSLSWSNNRRWRNQPVKNSFCKSVQCGSVAVDSFENAVTKLLLRCSIWVAKMEKNEIPKIQNDFFKAFDCRHSSGFRTDQCQSNWT